jgi:signal transduction histidine kinase
MDPRSPQALWAILEAVHDARGYADFLARAVRAVKESLPSDRANLYVMSARRGAFLPAADHGTPEAVVRDFVARGYAPGSFPGDEELRAGRWLLAVRGRAPAAQQELLDQARLYALALVPLEYQGEVVAVLTSGLERAPGFSAAQMQLLADLSPHLGMLIRSVRIEHEQARLATRRTRLASLASEVLTASAPDVMATRLCAASRAIFRASRADLLMLEDGMLVPRGVDADDGAVTMSTRRPLSEAPILHESLHARRVVVVNQFMTSRYAASPRAQELRPAAVLAIPLADVEGDLGLLVVSDGSEPFRFGPRDEEDARLLAAIATDTIRKGLLVESLRRASAAKSEFLASVSHDLRTPLNVILGYTDLLADETFGPVNDEQRDTLARVRRTSTGQLALIDDLLDLARIEQGKLTCQVDRVPVAALVGSLRDMMDALLRDRPIVFEVDVDADAVACTDPERLRQVLVNLLANAAKFTHHGRVRLSALRTRGQVEIRVADTGGGMDGALAQQAVEPFVRGSDAEVGSGLGLAIVSRLLRVLGGSLQIDSTLGIGTTVRVNLPAA